MPGLISISLHPGVIPGTSSALEFPAEEQAKLRKWSVGRGMRTKTQSQGASTALVAALDPKAKEFNGAYMADCQIGQTEGEGVTKDGAAEQ